MRSSRAEGVLKAGNRGEEKTPISAQLFEGNNVLQRNELSGSWNPVQPGGLMPHRYAVTLTSPFTISRPCRV